jgi:hypothetical protein
MPEVGPESAVAASRTVQGLGGRLPVRDYPGQEPPFVMPQWASPSWWRS